MGISWKLGPPSRMSCVSVYENRRPCSSGSLVKSMPGTRCPGWNATCSVSAKKLSGLRSSVSLPMRCTGTSSSGMSLVGSSRSKSNACSSFSSTICTPSSHSGKSPLSMASHRSRRWKSGILAGDLLRLVPHHRVHAEQRLPVELDEARLALGVDEAEGVDAEAFHHAQAARDGPVRHDPHDHVHRLGHERDEVPERVVGGRGLRHLVVRLRLHGVDEIGKLHRVLDEEDGDVVAHEVEVAFVGVELDGEAAHVARRGRSTRASRPPWRSARTRASSTAGSWRNLRRGVARPSTRRPGSSRGRLRRGRERRAREFARGRSG